MQLDSVDWDNTEDKATITISDLLETATYGWTARLRQGGLDLNLVIPDTLASHRLAVTQNTQKLIVDNLLSNMFRYASNDEACVIEVLQDKNRQQIIIAFSNKVTNISDKELPFLFDRFYRVSKSRTRASNEHPCGLGLSLVRQLCLSNQGHRSQY